jgi:hypothetical protein
VNESGFPTEGALIKFLEELVSDEQERITAVHGVRECFRKLSSGE